MKGWFYLMSTSSLPSPTVPFTSLKFNRLRKTLEGGIEIYNPDSSQKQAIIELLSKSATENNSLSISGKEFLITLLPMLSNIYIDTDNQELIDDIIDNPSDILLETFKEINKIVQSVAEQYVDNLNELSKLPQEDLEKLLKEFSDNTLTPEEEEIIKKAEEIKNKKLKT
jgi:predicted DNA binding protein